MDATSMNAAPRKVKILFLAANPSDTMRLRLDQEVRSIDQALRQAEYREAFDLEQHWAVRAADLQGLLLRTRPDIVHFSGHGSDAGELMLEDPNGNASVVSQDALSTLFSLLKDNIRVVVLNACYSASQAESIARQIDCVIGMSDEMGDQAAIAFSAAFYQAIAYGRDIGTAFGLARNQVSLEGLADADANAPQLLASKSDPAQIILVSAVTAPSSNNPSGVAAETATAGVVVQDVQARDIHIGDTFVDRRIIVNLGPEGMNQFIDELAARLRADQRLVQQLDSLPVSEDAGRQIVEAVAAEREITAQGGQVKPTSLYHLGMLAAYQRDYDMALDYLRQATQADPEYADAFESIVWLQQSLASADLANQDVDAATARLAEAREVAGKTDPLDPDALALRGYIAKTLAQIADAKDNQVDIEKYYREAERMFEGAVRLDPTNVGALNGLGNVCDARGDLDGAIGAYRQAIEIAPNYTSAHHDLAIAYEGKWRADPAQAQEWCALALQAWRTAYELAPDDPGFSAEGVVRIGQHIRWLKSQCGED